MTKTLTATDIRSRASRIAGATWDDRDTTGTLGQQLRTVAKMPVLGSDGDLTTRDRDRLIALAKLADRV